MIEASENKINICDDCILNGRCDGRCGDTDPLFYATEIENDMNDYYNAEDQI